VPPCLVLPLIALAQRAAVLVLCETELTLLGAPLPGAVGHHVVGRGLAVAGGASVVGDHPVGAVSFALEHRAARAGLALVGVQGVPRWAESLAVEAVERPALGVGGRRLESHSVVDALSAVVEVLRDGWRTSAPSSSVAAIVAATLAVVSVVRVGDRLLVVASSARGAHVAADWLPVVVASRGGVLVGARLPPAGRQSADTVRVAEEAAGFLVVLSVRSLGFVGVCTQPHLFCFR